MKSSISFLYFIFLLSLNLNAQLGKESWHWQFGYECSLDFSSGIPVMGTDSTNVDEGTASISDVNTGALLFYTDGVSVWDKNNHRMPNGYGLIGSFTSTQSALIVPLPGSSHLYYVFTSDQGGYCCGANPPANKGVHYSIVDMNLNGGLGNVTVKNQLLTPPPATEKLTAIKHCNDRDYWIITHPFNSNAFNAYLFTPSGVTATPVISNIGTVQSNIGGKFYETTGYLKASPNGKRLASAVHYMKLLEVFDFDNSNGQVSNPISLNIKFPPGRVDTVGAYGVCFSPDNSKLYATVGAFFTFLFQYDLSSGNQIIIDSTQVLISTLNTAGALQLASNNKIYVLSGTSSDLPSINNPNGLGLNCNYQSFNGLTFFPGISEFGLPNFIDANKAYPMHHFSNVTLCSFSSYSLSINGNNYHWSTGDTIQTININTFGDYSVSYSNMQGCKEIDTFHVLHITPPTINYLKDSTECGNSFSQINVNATYTNTVLYNWSDSFTGQSHLLTAPGAYWVDYSLNNFCVSRDSFNLYLYPYPIVSLGDDTTFCLGRKSLNAFNSACTYLWSTGETTPNIIGTHTGTFWVQVNRNGCISTDTLLVNPEYSMFNFIMPNIVTPNNDNINDFIDFGIYQFSSLQLDIYNRWGNKIFESSDPKCIWKPNCEDGSYYYVAQYRIDCGNETQSKTLKGFVTVIR